MFADTVLSWHDYYFMLGTSAATLMGLSFLSMTLTIDKLRKERYKDFRILAYRTFYTFVYVLIIAIIMLIPGQTPAGVAVSLLIVGGIGLSNTVRNLLSLRRVSQQRFTNDIRGRFIRVMILLIGLVIIAGFVWFQQLYVFYFLVFVASALLFSGCENAWDMFIGLYEA